MKSKKKAKGAVFLRPKISRKINKDIKTLQKINNVFIKMKSFVSLQWAILLMISKFRTKKQIGLVYFLLLFLVLSLIGTISYYKVVLAASHGPQPQQNAAAAKTSPIEVIGQQKITDDLNIGSGSYSGEVVSKIDVNIYAPREGTINNLAVNIGDKVWQGQSIGYLSVASEFEQVARTAEKKAEVETSRNKLDAVNTQLNDVRNRLNSRKSSAEAAKNAKITNANNAQSLGEITSQEKEERIKEAESDYSQVVTDADNEISGLTREQKEADKELQASEALSKTVNGGVDRNIYAARAGIISGIFKNVGDYVTGEDQIAAVGITSPTLKDRCVRFKIPGNQPLPKKGDMVTITRPGLPFAKHQAEITGVGTALDDNGHYVVEAFFDEIVDWPVHASVRVQANYQAANQILIPLSAVWFDNEGVTSAWVADQQNKLFAYNVKTGRAIGDRIEILDGLQKGDKLVLQPQDDFKNGDTIQEVGVSSIQREEVKPEGDGHGHVHEE